MHQHLIQSIVEEIRSKSTDNFFGRIFQLTPLSLAIDIGIRGSFLFLSAEPASPRFYLIQRKVKELEKQSIQLSHFGQQLRAQLGGGKITRIEKDPIERIVRLSLRVDDELGSVSFRRLIAQLTGRAANLFVVDELNRINATLRAPKGPGQNIAEYYLPPSSQKTAGTEEVFVISGSPSESADRHFLDLDKAKSFETQVTASRVRLRRAIEQKSKLRSNLEKDLSEHGDPDRHKRTGDLLLANTSTAVRSGNKTKLTDFYAENTPSLEIEVDENMSLQEAAAQAFRKYTKAKRAKQEISERLEQLNKEISLLQQRQGQLNEIVRARDEAALADFAGPAQPRASGGKQKDKSEQQIPGVRRYLSTDGYQILVGRAARDNDKLTFRIARPNDLWLHAADYPGSHVVVRNPTRGELPHRTVIEAAQLAGHFSQASDDSKVVVHYALRKFLAKPKGAAPGLVRMSSYRSITVEPKESVKRM